MSDFKPLFTKTEPHNTLHNHRRKQTFEVTLDFPPKKTDHLRSQTCSTFHFVIFDFFSLLQKVSPTMPYTIPTKNLLREQLQTIRQKKRGTSGLNLALACILWNFTFFPLLQKVSPTMPYTIPRQNLLRDHLQKMSQKKQGISRVIVALASNWNFCLTFLTEISSPKISLFTKTVFSPKGLPYSTSLSKVWGKWDKKKEFFFGP